MAIPLDAWQALARRHPHGGHGVAYFTAGDGEPLLLLHGFPTSAHDYQGQWLGLAQRYRVVAFDMMGYGLSDKPADYAYTIADQANIAQEVCAALGIDRCRVLCQDVGNTVCQELLARQLDGSGSLTLERVLLLNGGLFPEQHRATKFQQALLGPDAAVIVALITRESFLAGLAPLFGPDTHPDDATLDALWTLLARADGLARWPQLIRYIVERRENRERWVGALCETGARLRLVDGACDPISGRHMAEHYLANIPNPDVRILDDVGHFPQLEVPELILDEALRFFGDP